VGRVDESATFENNPLVYHNLNPTSPVKEKEAADQQETTSEQQNVMYLEGFP
jgi:hypothetical protein